MTAAFHVRIDHVTQGYDGNEEPADRLNMNHEQDLWIYVEARLPLSAIPQGKYFQVPADDPNPAGHSLEKPELKNGLYRFHIGHYTLSKGSKYKLHFADDLAAPTYEDSWEIVTVG
jgi:hypothetical protein